MNYNESYVDLTGTRLGAELTRRRMQQRLTKADLAEKSGLTYRTIHDLEEGRRDRILGKTLHALCAALETEPAEIMFGSDPAPDQAAGLRPSAPPSPRWAGNRRLLATICGLLITTTCVGFFLHHYALANATWVTDSRLLIAHDKIFGRTIWTFEAPAKVKIVATAPWSEDELIVLFGSSKEFVCLDRTTGYILWVGTLDTTAMITAFGHDTVDVASFTTHFLAAADLDGDGTDELIVAFHHLLYYPYALCVFDRHGQRLHQYASYGHLYAVECADIDNDGKDEIVAGGTNNTKSYQGGQIFILDEDHFTGATVDPIANPNSGALDGSLRRTIFPAYPPAFQRQCTAIRHVVTKIEVVAAPGVPTHYVIQAGSVEHERITIYFNENLEPTGSQISDLFRATLATWPDSLTDGTGPANDAWRAAWLADNYRFAAGQMVYGDSLKAATRRWPE